MLILLSGPSGAGKTFFSTNLEGTMGVKRLVAVTTRGSRRDELSGSEYEFVSKHRFQELIVSRALTDWDYLLGNYYGYRSVLEEYDDLRNHAVAVVVARMAIRLSQRFEHTYSVFLDASDSDLSGRISARRLSVEVVNERERQNREEREHSVLFDQVFSDSTNLTVGDFSEVLRERL